MGKIATLTLGLLLLAPGEFSASEARVAGERGIDPRLHQVRPEGEPRRAIRNEDLPLKIISPGSYYLAENITADYLVDKSITFAADHVTLDLMGFKLESGCKVLKSEPGSEHLLIRNGTVRSLDCAAIELGSYVQLIDIIALAGGTARGITLGERSRVLRTRGHGSDDGTGIKVARESIVEESIGVGAEDGTGIEVGEGSLIIHSQARAFGYGIGIVASRRTVVDGCTVGANYLGIGAGSGSLIINSTVRAVEAAAIYVASGATARGNSVQSSWIGIEAEGDGITAVDNTCTLGGFACIRVTGSNNRVERNLLDAGQLKIDGSANVVSENTVGGLIKLGAAGGAIEVAGARNLIQKNTITGAECGILFEDEGGHFYRENIFLAAHDAICGPPNVDGGNNIIPSMANCGDGVRQGAEICDGVDLSGHSCFSQGLEGPGLKCDLTCNGFDTSSCAASVCGSGTRRGDEVCDGQDFGGVTCQTLGFNGGRLRCGAGCSSFETSECCCTDGRAGCPECLCGNGILDPQEACDGIHLNNQTCISRGFEAGILACNATCTDYDVSGCVADGSCGNGIREIDEGEECDGTDLGGATCVTRAFDGGSLTCRLSCEFNTSGCVFVCGNGVRRGAEVCDGLDLNGRTCGDIGFDSGSLGCRSDCSGFDIGACTTVCGNGVRSGEEVCDANDVNSHTCQSEGFEAGILGCTSGCGAFDTSGCCCTGGEPGCTACPVCGNGVREVPFELCDGTDLGGETCSSQGRPPGTLACNSTCDGFVFAGCEGLLKAPKKDTSPN